MAYLPDSHCPIDQKATSDRSRNRWNTLSCSCRIKPRVMAPRLSFRKGRQIKPKYCRSLPEQQNQAPGAECFRELSYGLHQRVTPSQGPYPEPKLQNMRLELYTGQVSWNTTWNYIIQDNRKHKPSISSVCVKPTRRSGVAILQSDNVI